MPLQRINKKGWEREFQRAVSNIDENCGLTVTRSKIGNVELRHRGQGFNVVKTIPFKWEENWGDAYTRIRNIFKFITEGHNLKSAAELAQGKAHQRRAKIGHIYWIVLKIKKLILVMQ